MALSKPVNSTHAQTAVPCDVCEDETPGEYYCIECKHTLCPQCEKYHRKFTKGHNVVLRTQLGDIDTTVLTCTDHDDQASFHCEKCNIQVCIKCVTGKHRGHVLSDLKKIFDEGKTLLETYVTNMQQDVLPRLKKRRDDIIEKKKTYDKRIQQIAIDMEAEKNTLHAQIDRINHGRMKQLDAIQESNSSVFRKCTLAINWNIEFMERRMAEYENAIRKNSLPVVLKLAKMKEPLPYIGTEDELPEPPTFEPLGTQEICYNLGRLHFSTQKVTKRLHQVTPTVISKFRSPLDGFPSICITKEGEVWLGGMESKELTMVNIKGQVLRTKKLKTNVRAFTMMDCSDFIISPIDDSSKVVSIYSKENRNYDVFDANPSSSIGVSVTSDQEILICIEDGRVMKTQSHRNDIEEIYKGSGDRSAIHSVETADGDIYISDQTIPAVVIISKDGKLQSQITHTVEGKSLQGPLAFVVDANDDILCSDYLSHCVYIIDKNLQLRELMGHSYGLQNPRWLAVDLLHNLWITQNDGSVLVVKYFTD